MSSSAAAASSSTASSNKKMITLMSSDGDSFEIEESVISQSQTIKCMIEDGCADNPIPLPNVGTKILTKLIEYLKKHADNNQVGTDNDNNNEAAVSDEDLKNWDREYAKVDQATLFDLILAANYMNIKDLLDLMCQTVADMIKGKSPEEIRQIFNIKNDFTPEEEQKIRAENAWAFE